MLISDLKVAHWPHFSGHSSPSHQILPFLDSQQVFQLNTCQRSLWVYRSTQANDWVSETLRSLTPHVHSGESAYRLLLSVACGLESQILGETNIFGQLKEAWEHFSVRFSGQSPRSGLAPIFQKLFEDTKDIRSQYLRNSGGTSYGALVRKILHQVQSPILILGAGDIAQTVAPWLLDHELWLMNRDSERLAAFHEKLSDHPNARLRIIQKDEESRALIEASHLVICIPFDSEGDSERIRLWNQGAQDRALRCDSSSVVHLSGPRSQAGAWNSLSNFYCLDDLFALQESQGESIMMQIGQARKACADRAKLRALGTSLSIAHGWEYLAAFF